MNAPVAVPKEFSRGNETAFRNYIEGELANTYRKNAHVIIPFGYHLGFMGATGQSVNFGLDASNVFSITVDGVTIISFASSGDLAALEISLTAAFEAADTTLQANITSEATARASADTAIASSVTTLSATVSGHTTSIATNASAIATIDGQLSASYTIELDVDGRVTSFRLYDDGTTSDVIFKADAFKFFDGISDLALFEATGGIVTINGDLQITGSIIVGGVRWPISLQPSVFQKADGDAILWAGGSALNTIPDVTITVPSGVALASGEAWEPPTIQSATTTGGTLRLKISTPSTTTTVTDSTDAAGGGGDPDRVMAKGDSADAYNGVYNFRVQGNVRIRSTYSSDAGGYVNTGFVELSTWFDDGGGWDEGPTFSINPWDVGIDAITGSSVAGLYAYDATIPVSWASAIGAGGTYAYGVTFEAGGFGAGNDLTDLTSVSYLKQTTSGTRTGSPNGETATIIVTPKNQ